MFWCWSRCRRTKPALKLYQYMQFLFSWVMILYCVSVVCVRLEQYQCLQLQWRTKSVQYLVVSVWEDVFKKRNMTENHNDRSASTDRHKHTHTHTSPKTQWKRKLCQENTGGQAELAPAPDSLRSAVHEKKNTIYRERASVITSSVDYWCFYIFSIYFFICAGLHLYACVSVCMHAFCFWTLIDLFLPKWDTSHYRVSALSITGLADTVFVWMSSNK